MTSKFRHFGLALCLSLALMPGYGPAQTVFATNEVVDFDSPEGWAMAFMTTAGLNLGQLPPDETRFGDLALAAELGSIPRLNDSQQQVGFGGFKDEDLNKSPVFGRARASLGLFWDVTAELSWTPPVEIDGARPDGLWGLALSRPLAGNGAWGLGLRLFALEGAVRADVTCSADVASQPPGSPGNPFSCIEPSRDRLEMNHYGAELMLSFSEVAFNLEPWLAVASARMDPFTQIKARLQDSIERSTIDSRGTTTTYSAGLVYRFSDSWRVNLATSYTPLDVERPPGNRGGRENFWNARLGLTWDL